MVRHQAQLVRKIAGQFEDGTLPDTDAMLKSVRFALGTPRGIFWTTVPGTRDRAAVACDLRSLACLLELPEDDTRRPSPKRALELACQAAFDEPRPAPPRPSQLPWWLLAVAFAAFLASPLAPAPLSTLAALASLAALVLKIRSDKEAT